MTALLARFRRKQKPENDESYYTAGQLALIKARFKRKTSGVVAAWILATLVLMGFFAGFFSRLIRLFAARMPSTGVAAPRRSISGMKTASRCDRLPTPILK